ncbi:MAG: pyruvate kinase [Bdellovibrionales bacterium]|nr:pyruvate kinase [Bdellovibrionales bacterium]
MRKWHPDTKRHNETHAFSHRRVKIVATLGPSSSSVEKIRELIEEGVDVCRLNFSHGSHDFHAKLIANVREASKAANKPVAIMQDVQGPKIRCGVLPKEGIELKNGDHVFLYPEGSQPKNAPKGATLLPISAEIALPVSSAVQVGARILFDDGKLQTRALKVNPPEILVEVEVGGRLTSNKGMNLPGTPLSIPCLTEKDLEDIRFGIKQGVDAIAMSFVRSAEDIEELRKICKEQSPEPPILIAKIEREEAVEAMDSIIEAADGLLVARGDMAVELGPERVPAIQKKLIHSCNQLGVPIITATQMLESMIQSPTPTRAEASDVANAVFDGTDAVMLSGETASGQYPLEAVRIMSEIIMEAERSSEFYSGPTDMVPMPGSTVESIEFSASRIAHHVGAVAIACITHSGLAARSLAKFRPETPIIAIMDHEPMVRRLSFIWGVHGVLIPKILATDDLFGMVETVLREQGIAQTDDIVVVTAGIPSLRRGTTNMVKVHKIGR